MSRSLSSKKRETFLRKQARIFGRDKLALAALIIVFIYAIAAVFAPLIAPYHPEQILRDEEGKVPFSQPPSAKYLMGTTNMGRDVFSTIVYGTRTAFTVGVLTAISITVLGTLIGITAAFLGGWVDELLMRMADVCYAIPLEPFVIIIVSFLSPSIWAVVFGTTLLMWRSSARVIRAEALSLTKEVFIEAAQAIGASRIRILLVHLLPNVLPISSIYIALGVGWAILVEANVSFLGYGDPKAASWGKLLNQVFTTGALRHAWWWVLFPGLAIMLLVISTFFISRAYERELNPRLKDG